MDRGGPVAAHRPRKRFGQHFLVDAGAVQRILALVQPRRGEVVLEVGPGRGALTGALTGALERLVAVEIDRDLAALLRQRFAGTGLHLIEADILGVDLGQILRQAGGERLLVVGNLPYNITAPLLFKLLAEAEHIRAAVLMVQREVARRLVAPPGSRVYGLLSVLLAMRARAEIRLEVGRGSFRPVPGVDSAVIELDFEGGLRFPVADEALFGQLVRRAFGQRRKMLRNSLRGVLPGLEGERLEEALRAAGVEPERRPESLSAAEFARLSDVFGRAAGEG